MKSMLIISAAVASIFLSAGEASASAWTGSITIKALQTTRLEAISEISIAGTCVDSQYAYLSAAQENHKEVMTMLLAAMMGDKLVRLECEDTCGSSGDRCRVLNVEVKK